MVRSFADRNSLIETRIPADECNLLSFQSKVECEVWKQVFSMSIFLQRKPNTTCKPQWSLQSCCKAANNATSTGIKLDIHSQELHI